MNGCISLASRFAVQVLTLTLIGACVTMSPSKALDAPAGQPQPLVVQVENRSWEDIAVYLVRGELRVRLGTVSSLETRTFTPPPALITPGGELHLMAEPVISRRSYTSSRFSASPGQRVVWRVEQQLPLSSVRVQ